MIRTGDPVTVCIDWDATPREFDATFVAIDTARDAVTPEAVVVRRGPDEFRYPLDAVLVMRKRKGVTPAEQLAALISEIDRIAASLPYMTSDVAVGRLADLVRRRRELVPNVIGPACPHSTRPMTSRR